MLWFWSVLQYVVSFILRCILLYACHNASKKANWTHWQLYCDAHLCNSVQGLKLMKLIILIITELLFFSQINCHVCSLDFSIDLSIVDCFYLLWWFFYVEVHALSWHSNCCMYHSCNVITELMLSWRTTFYCQLQIHHVAFAYLINHTEWSWQAVFDIDATTPSVF